VGDTSDEERRRIAEKFMRVGESAEEKNKRAVEELFRGFMSQGRDIQSSWMPPPSQVDPKWSPPVSTVEGTIVQCRGCGQKNRVKWGPVGQPRCGKCKKDLGGGDLWLMN
jgi:hypothetical protein